jgi:hypothetical protein
MPCKRCGSTNEKKLIAEMSIRSRGLECVDKPGLLAFPELILCLDCGAADFVVSEDDLGVLAKGDAAAAG